MKGSNEREGGWRNFFTLMAKGWTLRFISAIKKQSLSFIDEGALTSCVGLSTTTMAGGGGVELKVLDLGLALVFL